MSYTIIENFLPTSLQNRLEEQFQYNTKWNYVSQTSGNENDVIDNVDKNVLECPQLTHVSHFDGRDHQGVHMANNPESFELVTRVLDFLELISSCTITEIHRIKINMNLQNSMYKGKYHPPHADHKSPDYFTLIYYIKDSDGPTRFFNKSTTDRLPYKDLKVITEVEPKKGKGILFPANVMHTGTCPINHENRLVINYIFKADNLKLDFENQSNASVRYTP